LAGEINERTFTGEAASWINEIVKISRHLPFSRAKIELSETGSLKRRDLSILDKSK
jgi:hypothetical protein